MCVWTEPVSHAACYINLPEMVVEGGGCVCGRSQYLMQLVYINLPEMVVEGGGCVCGRSQYLIQLVTSTYLRWWSRGADVCGRSQYLIQLVTSTYLR